jgi:hypothetical protein
MSTHDQVEALKRAVAAVTRVEFRSTWQRWLETFDYGPLGGFRQGAAGVHVNTPDPAAPKRARALLDRLMTPAQREEYRNTGRFTETVRGVRYRLGGRIEVLGDADEVVERWCTYPVGLCLEDVYIAQLLHLRSSPEALRTQAHVRAPAGFRNADARLQFLLHRNIHPPISVGDRELWQLLVQAATRSSSPFTNRKRDIGSRKAILEIRVASDLREPLGGVIR